MVTDPITGANSLNVISATLLGFYISLFGVQYGVAIAVVVSGIWGAFFAVAASSPPAHMKFTEPHGKVFRIFLRIIRAHTPHHRNVWRIILQGGVVSGLTAQQTANILAQKFPLFTVYDILLPLAFLIGMFSDELLPFLRRMLKKKAG